MLVHSVKLKNFLSFGESAETLELGPLNVLIGPNGSGKSNLLEAFELLRNAPEQLLKPIREGGGVRDWLWKGGQPVPIASLDVLIANPRGPRALRYSLAFTEEGQLFKITDEKIELQPWLEKYRLGELWTRGELGGTRW